MARHNLALALVVLALASTCFSLTFYASPEGTGGLCSASAPCSLTTAVSQLNDTDTVQLLAGTYNVNETTVVRQEAVTIQGEAGVELDCVATCFSFEHYPFNVKNMTLRSSDNSTAGTFIVSFNSTTNNVSGATQSVIESVEAELDDSNFLYTDYYTQGQTTGVSFSLIDVSITGKAANIDESPLYFNLGSSSASIEFSDVTFTGLTTSCQSPLLYTAHTQQLLSLESVSVIDSTISTLLSAGGVDAVFTDVTFTNVTTYNAPDGVANYEIIYLNTFSTLTVNGLFFESVTDERGLMFAYAATTVVNNVVIDNCFGPDDTIALNYAGGTGDPASVAVSDITFASSSYGMGLYLLESSSLMTTVSVSGLTATDTTTTTWGLISASNCNFTLSDFTVSKCEFQGGLVSLPGIGYSSVSDGSVSEVNATNSGSIFSNFYGYDSVDETFYDAEFKNITFYNVEAYSLIRVTPSNGTWTIAVEDCDIDTGNIDDVVNCDNQEQNTGSATVDVTSTSCDVTDGCGMAGYGYDDGSTVCVITLDEESVCCDDVDENGNPDDTDTGPSGWAIFAVVALVVCCVMLVVVGVIAAGLVVLKKQRQETYDAI